MEARGAAVQYHDPHIPVIPRTRDHGHLTGRRSINLDAKNDSDYDALVICTDHDDIDYANLAKGQKLIIDTRNAMSDLGIEFSENQVVRA